MIALGEAVVLAVVEQSCPVVIVGGNGGAQGDGNLLKAKLVGQLLGNALVALVVELAAVDVGVLGINTENVVSVFLVGDSNVDVLSQTGHGLTGFLTAPQLLAVVEVARNGSAGCLCRLAGLKADLSNVFAESGGDAGKVKPIHTIKDGLPVEVLGLCQSDGGVSAVVNNLGGTLGSTLFDEIGRAQSELQSR